MKRRLLNVCLPLHKNNDAWPQGEDLLRSASSDTNSAPCGSRAARRNVARTRAAHATCALAHLYTCTLVHLHTHTHTHTHTTKQNTRPLACARARERACRPPSLSRPARCRPRPRSGRCLMIVRRRRRRTLITFLIIIIVLTTYNNTWSLPPGTRNKLRIIKC